MLIKLFPLSELWQGEMRSFKIHDTNIVIIAANNHYYAYEDRCLHLGVPLSAGHLENTVLTCSAHHWQYDVTNGCGINPPCIQLRSFPLQVIDDNLWLEWSE
ncbi:MAG: Rieske 2Fe-2S domain-containing protein [Legionellales bacterium]|nr:Rieske 2Fe-2S domain-containing protein [Legionellales bacterium]